MFETHTFSAFNTTIACGFPVEARGAEHLRWVQDQALTFDAIANRFRSDSELSRFNASAQDRFLASPVFLDLLRSAQKFYHVTHGIFDPTIHDVLHALGYSTSFDALSMALEGSDQEQGAEQAREFGDEAPIEASPFTGLSFTEEGYISSQNPVNLDLGGIAKGYWVDSLVSHLKTIMDAFWVSAGGDVFLHGSQADGLPWELGVQDPLHLDRDLFSLKIPSDFGVATSGITKRHWKKQGHLWNHLIDPRTRSSVSGQVLSVTVVAPTVMEADVWAKTILILGVEEGLARVESLQDVECLILDAGLKRWVSSHFYRFL